MTTDAAAAAAAAADDDDDDDGALGLPPLQPQALCPLPMPGDPDPAASQPQPTEQLTMAFDLGEPRGIVEGTCSDTSGILGTFLDIPNSAWGPRYHDGDKSACRVEGYVTHFAWPEGASPAYIVRTLADDWYYYEFLNPGVRVESAR